MVSKEPAKFKVNIEYQSGWGGNRPTASYAASGIKGKFPGAIISMTPAGCWGALEITIVKDTEQKLVFSKRNGDGSVGPKNIDAVLKKIEEYIV